MTVYGSALVTLADVITVRSSCGTPSGPGRNTEGSSTLASAVVMADWSATSCGL